MADINYSVTLKVDKDNLSNSVSANGITADMSAVGLLSQTLTLSTSAISISTANLSSVGLAFLRNLSTATASVAQVGVDSGGTFVSFASLRAGEPAILRLTSGTTYKALGAAGTRLRVDITEG